MGTFHCAVVNIVNKPDWTKPWMFVGKNLEKPTLSITRLFFFYSSSRHDWAFNIFMWSIINVCSRVQSCAESLWPRAQQQISSYVLCAQCNGTGQLSEAWTSREPAAVIRRCLVQIPCGERPSGPKWELLSDPSLTDAPGKRRLRGETIIVG